MIRGFVPDNGRLRVADDPLKSLDSALWIDLCEPTEAEEAALEQHFHIDIPTREEMRAIEISSRLYHENDATFMNGVAFFQITDKGLMAHADITGTKFWKVDDLN